MPGWEYALGHIMNIANNLANNMPTLDRNVKVNMFSMCQAMQCDVICAYERNCLEMCMSAKICSNVSVSSSCV
jgi:hypothetical protein